MSDKPPVTFDEALIAQQLKWFNRHDAQSPVHGLSDLQVQIGIVSTLARCIDGEALNDWIAACARQHATMPIFDPTAYLRGAGHLQDWEQISAALNVFRAAVVKIEQQAMGRTR